MKKILLHLFFLFWYSEAFTQTPDDGTTEYHIPVVFHVVHDFGPEYINDEVFVSMIKEINDLFNKRNADISDVIKPFTGLINNSTQAYAGNARITFHLATKDPSGNPTIGILRHRSYLTNYGSDYVKFEQWPPDQYLNVWLTGKLDKEHSNVAVFSTSPAQATAKPYYDGLVAMAGYGGRAEMFCPELGRMLGLKYTFGDTAIMTGICGDDDVDDTPPTKGHDPAGGCRDLKDLFDTACLYTHNIAMNKPGIDSVKRMDGSYALRTNTSTIRSISFGCRTPSTLNSFSFYPAAPVGTLYKIGLKRDGIFIDSIVVLSTVTNAVQNVTPDFKIPAAPKTTSYELVFIQNPGAWSDTVLGSSYSKGVAGSILSEHESTGNYYNFFYDWKITHGYFKIYAGDSLVDYPDTTNAQNIMDQMFCSKMFTYGQVMKMRGTLRSPLAYRNILSTPDNLAATGALASMPSMKPKAEILVDRALSPAYIMSSERSYFTCLSGATPFSEVFQNKSWRAEPVTVNWILSNGTTVPASASTDKVITKFDQPGWATITMIATNTQGSDTASEEVYIADTNAINPIGYWQEFNSEAEYANWPVFNYYKNQYKWEHCKRGYFDNTGICYKNYDARVYPENLLGSPEGDFDDFFTPAFDLSGLGTNGNLNFMFAGTYVTDDVAFKRDKLEIAYSVNCGVTWQTLRILSGEELQTIDPVTDHEYLSNYNDWKLMSIDLKSGATKIRNSIVFFRFRYRPSAYRKLEGSYASGNNFYIDRIHISNNPLSVNEMILGDKLATLAPNPTNSNAFVLFGKPNANVHVSVTDVTGKLIYTVSTAIDQNNARVEIPASALGVKGFYMVHITGDDNLNQTEKLVVY